MSGRTTALARARKVRAVLLDHGVPEVSIEVQDGRPTYGEDTWNALRPVSVFSHHIASYPSIASPTPGLALVKQGRPDLDGPLANGTAGVDLVYRILTLGWANHPGYGGPLTVRGPCGAYTIPKDNARPYAWGTEFEGGYSDEVWDRTYTNKRTGMSMTFREFMGRVNAGLCQAIWLINGHGKTPRHDDDLSGYHGEHLTWAPGRKFDRRNYTTDSGRREVARYNLPAVPADPMETVMSFYDTKREFEDAIEAAAARGVLGAERIGKPPVNVDTALSRILAAVSTDKPAADAGDAVDLASVQTSIDRLARAVRASRVDPAALADALAAKVGGKVDQATVEAALRTVLTEGVG